MNEGSAGTSKRLYAFGPFRLDVAERRLLRDGVHVPLSPKVFDLLLLFVEDAGHLKAREELIGALWPKSIVAEHGLTNKLHALRKALGDDGDSPVYIETVAGIGYRFIVNVTQESKAKATSSGLARPRRHVRLAAVLAGLFVLAALITAFTYEIWPAPDSQTITSIAVLPFENLSANDANAYFAAGIQDTILTRLTGIQGLRVTPRTSVGAYSSHPDNLREIAEELGVKAVLEGSVQQDGKDVLINVRLIDVTTNAQLWAKSYTRTLDDVFDVEGEVAGQVATALSTQLRPAEMKRLTEPATASPRAYVLFLKANYNSDRVFMRSNAANTGVTAHRAVALYRRAIALDPNFALAYAKLSLLESKIYWFNPDAIPEQKIGAATADAKRALALDQDLPQAWMAVGYVSYYGDLNYDKALVQFRHAQKLLPHSAALIAVIAQILGRQGKTVSALAGLHEAARLDPRNPHWLLLVGRKLIAIRHYDEAGRWLDRSLALEPDNYLALISKANIAVLTVNTNDLERITAKIPTAVIPRLVSELHFQAAYLDRNADRALAVLEHAPDWVTGMNTIPSFPTGLLQAQAWTLKGDNAKAHHYYRLARDRAKRWLHEHAGDPSMISALGLAEAGLGNAAAAIKAGRHSVNYIPVSHDAILGAFYLAAMAQIYGLLNEAKPAVRVLDRLLAMPAGRAISVPLLQASPLWDGIRNSPEFQALLKKYAPYGAEVAARTSH